MSADQLHIDATRKQDQNAIVEVSWTDLSNVFGLDPGEPEDLRAIYDCAEEGGDLMILQHGDCIRFRRRRPVRR